MTIDIVPRIMRIASFEFWLPAGQEKSLKALVVLADGSNGDGRGMAHDKKWQRWAERNQCGLIGCFLMDKDPNAIEGYADAKVESGSALLWAIRTFDDRHKNAFVNNIPLLMWGFSAGGQFAYEMNAAFPERVGAFCANKGGIYYTALCSERARRNPGMLFIGKNDAEWRKDVVKGLVAVNNRGGAQWRLVEENSAHTVCQSDVIGREFFEEVLAAL